MRFTFHNEHYRHFLTGGTADWLWPAAEKAGVPLMVLGRARSVIWTGSRAGTQGSSW